MARAYNSPVREQAMRETRRRILTVATEQLLEGGYGAMTVAGLARAAGVAPQTVYNAVGGKAEVVKAAYDLLLAGDEAPRPMRDRPGFRAVQQARGPAAYGRAYAAWTRAIYERVGDFLGALLGGTAGDPVLADFVATIDRERRVGNELSIPPVLRERLGERLPRALDVVWLLTAPETHARLTRRAGWTGDEYERWLADELARVVSGPPTPRAAARRTGGSGTRG